MATVGSPCRVGQLGQRVVAVAVGGVAVVGQLDGDVVRAEQPLQAVELARGRVDALGEQGVRDRALAAAGEHEHVVLELRGDVFEQP